MEEVEVSVDELPPDLNDYLTDLAGLIEELIARGRNLYEGDLG